MPSGPGTEYVVTGSFHARPEGREWKKEMTIVNKPLAGTPAVRRRRRPGPPTRLTLWLFYALAALVVAVTIAMTARSGTPTCTSAAPARAAQHHAQIRTCAPAVINP